MIVQFPDEWISGKDVMSFPGWRYKFPARLTSVRQGISYGLQEALKNQSLFYFYDHNLCPGKFI